MAALEYPSTLPGPKVAPADPTERRDLTEGYGPREARAFQRDRHFTQRLQFKFTPNQVPVFTEWIETTLAFGGCWFAAYWRIPPGGVAVRRFIMESQNREFLATGHWLISIDCEVRGRGELPQIESEEEIPWNSANPVDSADIEPPVWAFNTSDYFAVVGGTGS